MEFTPSRALDLEALIDRLEEADDDALDLDYPPDASWLKLRIEGASGQIEFSGAMVSIVHAKPGPPGELLRSFLGLQETLLRRCGASSPLTK